MELLRLSIRSTLARVGMESPRGDQSIQQPRGELEISAPAADMQIRQPRGELVVDSHAAWVALAKGGTIEVSKMLAQQAKGRTLDVIATIVEEGNRMKQITNKSSAIADIASQALAPNSEVLRVVGPASYTNVKLNYTPHPTEIETTPQRPQLNYQVNKPIIEYTPQKVKFYMDQMNSVKMWVSQYDLYA